MTNVIKYIFYKSFILGLIYAVIGIYNSTFDAFDWSNDSKLLFGILTFIVLSSGYGDIEEEKD